MWISFPFLAQNRQIYRPQVYCIAALRSWDPDQLPADWCDRFSLAFQRVEKADLGLLLTSQPQCLLPQISRPLEVPEYSLLSGHLTDLSASGPNFEPQDIIDSNFRLPQICKWLWPIHCRWTWLSWKGGWSRSALISFYRRRFRIFLQNLFYSEDWQVDHGFRICTSQESHQSHHGQRTMSYLPQTFRIRSSRSQVHLRRDRWEIECYSLEPLIVETKQDHLLRAASLSYLKRAESWVGSFSHERQRQSKLFKAHFGP